jgi:hypothetical protein
MKEQNYKNHRQIVYGYYLMTGVPILLLIGFAISMLVNKNYSNQNFAILFLVTGWILLTMLFRSRGFALKAQDRAIRAEENLRYFILTGKRLDPSITTSQIIALRFADDEEFPSLTQRVADEKLSSDAIKKQIKNWRSDLYRA